MGYKVFPWPFCIKCTRSILGYYYLLHQDSTTFKVLSQFFSFIDFLLLLWLRSELNLSERSNLLVCLPSLLKWNGKSFLSLNAEQKLFYGYKSDNVLQVFLGNCLVSSAKFIHRDLLALLKKRRIKISLGTFNAIGSIVFSSRTHH